MGEEEERKANLRLLQKTQHRLCISYLLSMSAVAGGNYK